MALLQILVTRVVACVAGVEATGMVVEAEAAPTFLMTVKPSDDAADPVTPGETAAETAWVTESAEEISTAIAPQWIVPVCWTESETVILCANESANETLNDVNDLTDAMSGTITTTVDPIKMTVIIPQSHGSETAPRAAQKVVLALSLMPRPLAWDLLLQIACQILAWTYPRESLLLSQVP